MRWYGIEYKMLIKPIQTCEQGDVNQINYEHL